VSVPPTRLSDCRTLVVPIETALRRIAVGRADEKRIAALQK
jgi:hypothetical protein